MLSDLSRLPQQAIALSEDPRTETGDFVRGVDVCERAAHPVKPINAVPFPFIPTGGTGTPLPPDQSSRRHPMAVRLKRPARSGDSSASPRRSFLTARQSRSFAQVSTMPPMESGHCATDAADSRAAVAKIVRPIHRSSTLTLVIRVPFKERQRSSSALHSLHQRKGLHHEPPTEFYREPPPTSG